MSRLQEQRIEILKRIAMNDGGLITTAQIENAGIHRSSIPTYINAGILVKEGRGIYYYAGELPDELQLIQKNNPKVIFSYGTALYLWALSERIPHTWDISVPQGFNATRIKKDHGGMRVHYINVDKWGVGITETLSPNGNRVRLYDKERCVIDLIKKRDSLDKQLFIHAMHEYFKEKSSDKAQLIRYAKIFHIEQTVRYYMDVLAT